MGILQYLDGALTFNEYSITKNSIFVIQNADSTCLAAALIVSCRVPEMWVSGENQIVKWNGPSIMS
jgi:hypothetical protein